MVLRVAAGDDAFSVECDLLDDDGDSSDLDESVFDESFNVSIDSEREVEFTNADLHALVAIIRITLLPSFGVHQQKMTIMYKST